MSKLIELSAVYYGECLRFDDTNTIIGEARLVDDSASDDCDPFIKIKGIADLDELNARQAYRFFGRWKDYTNRRTGITEKQFNFDTFVEATPQERGGIIAYLKRAGEGNNIGNATAEMIYEKFGSKSVQTLREQPEVVAEAIKRLKVSDCEGAAEWLRDRQALENCTIDLTNLLSSRGFPKDTATKAIKLWGNRARNVIKKNPYVLMSFRGCGFKRCDSLYMDLGLDPSRLLRQALCLWYTIASNNDGHTWFTVESAIQGLDRQINRNKTNPARALKLAKRIGRLSLDAVGAIAIAREQNGAIVDSDGKIWVAEGRKAASEQRLALSVSDASTELARLSCPDESTLWPEISDIPNIDIHQRNQLAKALRDPVAILCGGPGTGKTFCGANLIKTIAKKVGYDNIAVGAPTGKAAVRITEVMQEYGVPIQARTWHSLLGVGEQNEVSGNWTFLHNNANPWPFKVIIGDETSMNDTNLMNSIMQARATGTHMLLLGDTNQLPPVGHGAPLRDLIAAGVSAGELTQIKRNSGGIVEACKSIREGQPWEAGDNLKLIPSANPSDQCEAMIQVIGKHSKDFDPVWDCQVLVAVNEKSKLGRKALNQQLQDVLNTNPEVKNCPFRVGDKIVNLKNGFFPLAAGELAEESEANDKDEVYVANGELARVVEVEPKCFVAEVLAPKRVIRIPRGKNVSTWDLGYALSCHKSQGSEWPIVIVMLDEYPGAKMVCSREWLYTAISRAKKRCVLIGKKHVADAMCRRTAIDKRKTFLRERIHLEQAKKALVNL